MNAPAINGGSPVRPDGPPSWPGDWPDVRAALDECLQDGSWGRYHGPHCSALAGELKAFHDIEDVLLCASGTAGVELALRGVRVEPGDEVVLAAYDFKANFQNVLALGAVPVLVDLDPGSWQIDVSKLEAAFTSKTKAVIVSHLHGGSVSMPAVMELAERHGVSVIEDACQATGAILNGQRGGTVGHVGVLSFGGSKLLTAGRGGAVMTGHPGIAQRIRLYTRRGNEAYPLSEMQAAVLRPQLQRLDERNRHRAENASFLLDRLAEVSTSTGEPLLRPLVSRAQLAQLSEAGEAKSGEGDRPAFYKVGFQYSRQGHQTLARDHFVKALRAEGVAMDAGFRALHCTHSPRRFRSDGELTEADQADERAVVLHHPVLLEERPSIEQIRTGIERVWQNAAEIQSALASE